ncbi:Peptidyl-prolyl cis-trans isomerase cyp6 [Claviceps sp. LM218 group G6]|nr:Peptidyl-prolyl cis-trans isomerase cyp6 [Claviceps sp. LM218 group G6]
MSVLLETSAGDIVIDLLIEHAPKLCENFLKLCKIKYYNFSPVHSVQKNFSFQTGDPLGPLSKQSDGGSSIWGHLSGEPSEQSFPAFFHPKLKHLERGTVSMATVPLSSDPDTRVAASQFIITLGEDTDFLNGKAAIFGKVVEGFDALEKINEAVLDDKGHPLIDIRIKHTVILDDPYPDPPSLREPSASPPPTSEQLKTVRIADEAALYEDDGVDEAELERRRRQTEANAQALTLEMMGDLPFAEVKPPENILFVCKLNPVTGDDDLELIFGRFGKILSCEVIRDQKTGDSLQYAFIEYEEKASCEAAYFKMQGVLIDDRRIHVDFSQSVSKLSDVWRKDANNKRKTNASRGGGWGGVRELEKRKQYRAEDDRQIKGNYGLVYGEEEMKGRHARSGVEEHRDGDEDAPKREGQERRISDRSRSPQDRDTRGDGERRGGRRHEGGREPRRDGSYRDDSGWKDRDGDRHRDGYGDHRDHRDADRYRGRHRDDSYRSRR